MTSLRTQLEELAGKVTDAPWSVCVDATGDTFVSSRADSVETVCEFGAMDSDESQEQLDADAALIVALRNNLATILAALDAVEWRSIETLTDEDGDVLGWAAHSGFGLTFNFSNPWATHWRPLGPVPEGG